MAGGGMKSSFGAGVMNALAQKYGVVEPFLLVGASGSVGTGAYYLTGQYAGMRRIWTELLSSKRVINKWRFWKIIDIDYLVDVIFKKEEPLLTKKLFRSKTKYLIALLNKETGTVDYLNGKTGGDVFEKIRAAKSIPLAFKLNPTVLINNKKYCDSIISANPYAHIKKVVEQGAKKILIIENYNPLEKNPLEKLIYFCWVLFQGFSKSYYQNGRELLGYNIPKEVETFIIKPQKNIQITTLNNRKELLKQTFQQGYEETMSNRDLKLFLEK